jgi:DNA-binding XRE family transcriptional regulator
LFSPPGRRIFGAMADEQKHAGGRPTDYRDEYPAQAEKLCKLGATDKELADFFGVTEQTINNWKDVHDKFFESIKAGKELADANVAQRLYERAMGFEHDSEEIKVVDGAIERVPTRKIYPPDTAAAIFWLKNRQKEKWRDKTDHGLENPDGTPIAPPIINVYTNKPKDYETKGKGPSTGTPDEDQYEMKG